MVKRKAQTYMRRMNYKKPRLNRSNQPLTKRYLNTVTKFKHTPITANGELKMTDLLEANVRHCNGLSFKLTGYVTAKNPSIVVLRIVLVLSKGILYAGAGEYLLNDGTVNPAHKKECRILKKMDFALHPYKMVEIVDFYYNLKGIKLNTDTGGVLSAVVVCQQGSDADAKFEGNARLVYAV